MPANFEFLSELFKFFGTGWIFSRSKNLVKRNSEIDKLFLPVIFILMIHRVVIEVWECTECNKIMLCEKMPKQCYRRTCRKTATHPIGYQARGRGRPTYKAMVEHAARLREAGYPIFADSVRIPPAPKPRARRKVPKNGEPIYLL